MTNEMKAFLPELISGFLEEGHGSSLTISKTANPDCECLVITNMQTHKVCLLGSLVDESTGENKIGAATVNLENWIWAADEGFTTDQIVNQVDAPVFKIVCPGDLHILLS